MATDGSSGTGTTGNSNAGDDVIRIGTLVEIHGLQSEGGRKLNGGQGFVLKRPETIQGNVRYPVIVYAVLKNEEDDEEDDEDGGKKTKLTLKKFTANDGGDLKSIKIDNLTVLDDQRQELFKEVAIERIGSLGAERQYKACLPWAATYCKIWPDGDGRYNIVMHYCDLLTSVERKPTEALDVLLNIADQVPSTFENYNNFLCQFAYVCYHAGSHFEEALEKAYLIPTDTPATKKMAAAAFRDVCAGVSKRNQQDVKRERPEMFEVQLQAAKALYEISPTLNNLYNIGCAYCLKGNNVAGARHYRRILAEAAAEAEAASQGGGGGKGQRGRSSLSIPTSRLEGDLITAQLQCPGMPLENYMIVSRTGGQFICVHKDDRDKFATKRKLLPAETDRPQADTYIGATDEGGLDLLQFPIPNGPKDPNVFPQSFLDTLKE